MSRRPALLTALLCLASLTWAAEVSAQGCNDAALDTFQSARRARRILNDHDVVSQAAGWEALRAHEARLAFDQGAPDWTIQAYMVGDGSLWGAPRPLCARGGRPAPADLTSGRVGLSVSVMEERLRMGLQLFATQGYDVLTIDPEASAPSSVEAAQTMYGVRVQPWRWTQLTLARIVDEPLLLDPEAPDAFPIDPDQLGQPRNAPRYYVALGVPALGVSADVILSPQDEGLQTLFLDISDLPIPALPWLLPRASVARLDDEERWVGLLGTRLRWRELSAAPRSRRQRDASLIAEASAEWPAPRWRQARLRLEGELRDSELGDEGLSLFDAGAALEGTAYSSAWLERRSAQEADAALGAGLYGWARWSARPLTLGLELGWATNRPETLSQRSELRDALEVRAMFVVQYTR